MRSRFVKLVAFLCVVAGVFAGVASALDFDEEDPAPVQGEVGRVMDYDVGTHGGCLPHRLVIQSGSLPPGTELTRVDDHTSEVEGIPTQAGTYSVWLAVKDCQDRSAEMLFTFEIGQRTYSIRTASLPPAALGRAYTAKLEAGGHAIRSEEWTLESGSLPAGVALAPDGTISGTPTAVGSSTFTVKATSVGDDDAIRLDSKQLTLTVAGGSLTVTASRRVAEVGRPFRATLAASGGRAPLRWSATGGLPAGLTVTSDGVVTGVPRRAGTYAVALHFVDANGVATDARLSLVVRPKLAIAGRGLAAAVAGRPYRAKIAVRGGVGPLRWSATGLPHGLVFPRSTGTIAGTPAGKGLFRVRVRVRDSLGAVATRTFALRVR
jgi:hypothetical protein